jgi:hypothetical protein
MSMHVSVLFTDSGMGMGHQLSENMRGASQLGALLMGECYHTYTVTYKMKGA